MKRMWYTEATLEKEKSVFQECESRRIADCPEGVTSAGNVAGSGLQIKALL